MSMKIAKSALAAALAGGLLAGVAQAYEAGNWLFRIGAYGVFPESDNLDNVPTTGGATLDVDDGYSLGFNFTYMVNPNFGIELLLALPFQHDITLSGSVLPGVNGKIAEIDHLPPTLSLQYHFTPESNFRPYVGIGLNYTTFNNEDTTGALERASLELDDSWGVAGQIGIDIDVAPNWFLNADLRYIGISSEAKLSVPNVGTVNLGDVDINPWVLGLTIGTRF